MILSTCSLIIHVSSVSAHFWGAQGACVVFRNSATIRICYIYMYTRNNKSCIIHTFVSIGWVLFQLFFLFLFYHARMFLFFSIACHMIGICMFSHVYMFPERVYMYFSTSVDRLTKTRNICSEIHRGNFILHY